MALLEAIVRQLPVGVAVYRGSDLRFLLANAAHHAIAPGKEMVGRTLEEVWPEAPGLVPIFRRVLETGEPHRVAHDLIPIRRTPEGPLEDAWFTWSLERIRLPGDGGWGLLNTAWETTERKEIEESLKVSERKARARAEEVEALMEAMPALTFLAHDPDCRRMTSNRAALEMLRLPTGANTSKSAPDGERPGFRVLRDGIDVLPEEMPVQKAAATGEPQRNSELTIDFGEGRTRHLLGDAVPLFDESGAVRGAVGAFLDITSRTLAEQAARESEHRYRELFATMREGCAHCRMAFEEGRPTDFLYLDVNAAFEEQTGLKGVVGRWATEAIPGIREASPELFEIYGRVALTAAPEKFEMFVEPLGQWFSVSVYSPEREHFIALFDVITERKRAEETLKRNAERLGFALEAAKAANDALRQSEEKFQKAFRASPAALVISRKSDGTIVDANEAYGRILGVSPADMIGRSSVDLQFFPDDAARRAFIRRLETEGPSRNRAGALRRPSGEVRQVLTSSELIDLPGEPCVLSAVEDITESLRAERALRESEERFRSLVEQAADAVFVHDFAGRFVMVNRQACESLGYSRDELLAMSVPDVEADFDLASAQADWARIQPDQPVTLVGHQRRKDGSVFPVEVRFGRFELGGRTHFVGLARDISERLRAEAELRAHREHLEELVRLRTAQLEAEVAERRTAEAALARALDEVRDLYDNAPCGYHSVGPDGTFLAMNSTELGWIGYSRDEVVGRLRLTDLLDDEGRKTFSREFPRFLEKGAFHDVEFDLVRKDGSRLPVVASATAIRDEAGRFVMSRSTVFDDRERRAARSELLRLNATLEEKATQVGAANGELEAFSYSVSHDLRAPLRAIDGFARMLSEDHAERLDGEGQRLLGVIQRNAHQMAQLIDDLLAFSRVGRTELRRVPIDMRSLAGAAWDEVAPAGGAGRPELAIGPLPDAVGDPALLHQVFTNLLSNAVKFSGRAAAPRVEVLGGHRDGQVVYTVADNGVGFDMQYADKLFKVFQRLHSPKEYPGTGVGLALVHRIVTRHGGRVWAEARPGSGAAFSFSLPAGPGGF